MGTGHAQNCTKHYVLILTMHMLITPWVWDISMAIGFGNSLYLPSYKMPCNSFPNNTGFSVTTKSNDVQTLVLYLHETLNYNTGKGKVWTSQFQCDSPATLSVICFLSLLIHCCLSAFSASGPPAAQASAQALSLGNTGLSSKYCNSFCEHSNYQNHKNDNYDMEMINLVGNGNHSFSSLSSLLKQEHNSKWPET